MRYVVSPPEETDWSITPDAFVGALRARWPDAHIDRIANPHSNHAAEWSMQLDGRPLEGSLDRAGQAIVLDGDLFSSAQFARWLRTLVPHAQPLVFYDESYSADVALTETTTAEQLTAAFVR